MIYQCSTTYNNANANSPPSRNSPPTYTPISPITLLNSFLFLNDFTSPIEVKAIPIRPQGNRLIKNRDQKIALVLFIVIGAINNPKKIGGSRYINKAKKYILYIFIFNWFLCNTIYNSSLYYLKTVARH